MLPQPIPLLISRIATMRLLVCPHRADPQTPKQMHANRNPTGDHHGPRHPNNHPSSRKQPLLFKAIPKYLPTAPSSNVAPQAACCPAVATTVISTPVATVAAGNISPNGLCGPNRGGYTCLGSTFGDCCSQYGFCGGSTAYCEADNCLSGYGSCNTDAKKRRRGEDGGL